MDPFRTLLNLSDGKRHYMIDADHVTQEEFEAAAILADVLWCQEGLAEMLGSTWRMVHDPRFLALERCGIYEQRNMFQPGKKKIGQVTVRCGDLFSYQGSGEDMTIYAEILGEGRHFRDAILAQGGDPSQPLTEEQIWTLIKTECPNYLRRNGTWCREAETVADLLRAGMVSMVHDYADIAYCTDWMNMDTQCVVPPGQRTVIVEEDGEETLDETSIVAVEVENLFRALQLRAQVRMTAYKLLKQLRGIKADELDNLTFTDLESDAICQILFKTPWDKLYTAMPEIVSVIHAARGRAYEDRIAAETARLRQESAEFNTKLRTGEIEQIVTEIAGAPEGDPSAFIAQLVHNPYYASLFQGLQTLEARGSEAARLLCEELVSTHGAGDVWDRIAALVRGSEDSQIDQKDIAQREAVHGTDWTTSSQATQMVLGENVHANVTVADEVFEGVAEQAFNFVYLNPHADPRGYHTAIVDLRQADGDFARRTWHISPEQWKQIADKTPAGASPELLAWMRHSDHNTGIVTFELQGPVV